MKDLLIIGFVWPEPNSTAAGTRMLQLIELFQSEDYEITFVCAASKTTNTFNLEKLNIKTFEIELNDSSFDVFLKSLNPSIILFDRFLTEEQFGWRVSETCPNALRILDSEDLHFLRSARKEALKQHKELSLDLLMNDTTKRELASIYRCDVTLIISKFEFKLLKKTFKIDTSLLHYIPFLQNNISLETIDSFPTFQNRKHFMTIGNFRHEPNWNAVLYLKKDIWPLIKQQLPDAKILIYGAYATEKAHQLQNIKEGFMIKGWAKSSEDVFKNARICLAPLLFGAGLKGKLIESMQFGTPSVTTSIGAESMHHKLPWNGFIENNPKDFAKSAVTLYTNEKMWRRAQINGLEIIDTYYSKEKYSKQLLKKVKNLQLNLKDHRLQNFIGAVLTHHTLKSTKYLSKWIEEKNSH
ncbi:MAG: glycosyltransferase family 4 protein [Lutibacter sp.]|uniref:glycosyltransferase family 4 protein n=1 Tax=Lutibacter sp. TaxID=1925666 RepID=UPI00181ABF17|nr:glycosyltransferase family 4 protein [Lutibacter sp.]MBT8317329.1 glycosyltransferase family 4 protein [Lutibacter sp.]NNJ58188.1 glycosyltransferase family 4 protein [Lutibacter sp.]